MNPRLIKTDEQIEIMRKGGKLLSQVLSELADQIKPGLDVIQLENHFIAFCHKNNLIPTCKGYTMHGMLPPFPTGLCVSINNQSVHCYPKNDTILKNGDILTVDTVIQYRGLNVDAAFAKGVGDISEKNTQLINASKNALLATISQVKEGIKIGLLSETMQKSVEKAGFNVLRDYAGHGIGKDMHEDPEIPCFGKKYEGAFLYKNMTICLESLVCEGNYDVKNTSIWETQMADKKNFVQFEHTVLVKEKGYEILTDFTI
jgi:methionyl aminopeptidase